MKKTLTLLMMAFVALSGSLYAQTPHLYNESENVSKKTVNLNDLNQNLRVLNKDAHGVSRAASTQFILDYVDYENTYATSLGADFFYTDWNMNKGFVNDNLFTLDFVLQIFDVYYDGTSYAQIPNTAVVNKVLDSIAVPFTHSNVSGDTDMLIISVYDRSTLSITGSGATEDFTGTILYADTFVFTSSMTASLDIADVGEVISYPNLALADGQDIAIRLDYLGDTLDRFNVYSFFRDECGGACAAREAIVNTLAGDITQSWYYLNLNHPTAGNLSGINGVILNCNGNSTYDEAECEAYYPQNHWIVPFISSTVELTGSAVTSAPSGCPNDIIDIDLSVFGAAPPYTVSWTPTTGLSDPNAEDPSVSVGPSSVTYTAMIIDASGDTAYVDVPITSNGITVNAGTDQTVACGTTANLVATIGGTTSGASYVWSNGPTTFANNGVSAGTYTVTVTNAAGCTATDAVIVSYPGVTQTVDFTTPSPICQNNSVTFINNSAKVSGWSFTWDESFTGSQVFTENASFTFTTVGVGNVVLTADSAGCSFSRSKSVTVISETVSPCVGIEDLSFANAIDLYPNPTKGTFTVNINGLSDRMNMSVYGVDGKVVYTSLIEGSVTKTVSLENVSAGIYYVKFESGDKVAVKKLSIQ